MASPNYGLADEYHFDLTAMSNPYHFKTTGNRGLTYLDIATVYSCNAGFNAITQCDTTCLLPEVPELNSLSNVILNNAFTSYGTNIEYFIFGFNITCPGMITDVGIGLDSSSAGSQHDVVLTRWTAQFAGDGTFTLFLVSRHTLSFNTGSIPASRAVFHQSVQIPIPIDTIISFSSATANFLFYNDSSSVIWRRAVPNTPTTTVHVSSLTSLPSGSKILSSIRFQEQGKIIGFDACRQIARKKTP